MNYVIEFMELKEKRKPLDSVRLCS